MSGSAPTGPAPRPRLHALPIAASAVWAAALAALVPGALFRGETFGVRDLATFHRPARVVMLRLERDSGGLPLWNPYRAAGQPFAANPHYAVFHPLTALFRVLPFEPAFRLQVLLPLLATGAAMGFLLRTLGRSPGAALFGSLAWGLGGYALSAASMLPVLWTAAPLPAVLAFVHRLARGHGGSGGASDAAGLAASFSLVALGGEPVGILATLPLVAAALAVARSTGARGPTSPEGAAIATGGRSAAKAAAKTAAALALGAAIAAASILPAVMLGRRSVRASGLPREEADLWSMPPVRWAELASPEALGRIEGGLVRWHRASLPGAEPGTGPYRRLGEPLVTRIYFGLGAAALALAAALGAPRRHAPWIAAVLLGAAASAGENLPVWDLARRALPPLGGVRYPEKLVLLALLPLAVLAAEGFDQALRDPAARRRTGLVIAALSLGGMALGAPAGMSALVAPLLASAAVLGALWLARAGAMPAAAALLVVAAAADLVRAGRPLLPTVSPESLDRPPPFLAPLVDPPLPGYLFHAAALSERRLHVAGLAEPPIPNRWGIATVLENDFDLSALAWTAAAHDALGRVMTGEPALLLPCLERRSVAAVLAFRGAASAGPTEAGGSPSAGASVAGRAPPQDGATHGEALELRPVPGRRPLVFLAERAERIAGTGDWLDAVRRLGPAVARTALVEAPAGTVLPAAPSPGRALVVGRSPVRLELEAEVDGRGPGLLAIDQTWDRGWSASVDGRPTALLRAELSLGALLLEPGRHRVVLSYDDPAVRHGVHLSLAALAVTASLALAPATLRSRRHPTRPPAPRRAARHRLRRASQTKSATGP